MISRDEWFNDLTFIGVALLIAAPIAGVLVLGYVIVKSFLWGLRGERDLEDRSRE